MSSLTILKLAVGASGPTTGARRFPSLRLEQSHSIRRLLVSAFLADSIEQAINIYERSNVPLAKMNIRTPFYGYDYENVSSLFGPGRDCGNTVLSRNYGTFIKRRINARGWRTSYDLRSMVPFMLRADGIPGYITYDEP
jgi:hypothetical protein